MFDVVAPFDAERDATHGVAAEETHDETGTPLVTGAFVLEFSPLFFVVLAMRALKTHRSPLSKESRNTNELPLLLCDQKL